MELNWPYLQHVHLCGYRELSASQNEDVPILPFDSGK